MASKDSVTSKLLDRETYEDLLDQLNDEKERIEYDLRKEYRNARKYVRAHPEQGVGFAFLGGIIVGILVTSLFRTD
ncbi:MAG: hypothetical protein ACNA8K_09640 [Cyclonatronaceae bacterium]